MAATSRESIVAVFTRTCELGRVKSRLARTVGDHTALHAHRALLERTLAIVAESGLDAELWIDGDPRRLPPHRLQLYEQSAGDLGHRMAAVVDHIVARGRAAIVVGGDCPVLDAAYLREAADALAAGIDVVIGPVEDGGYVLIGLRAPQPALFERMPWSTPAVHAETLRRAAALGLRTCVLRELWDVDDEASWRRWRTEAAATAARPTSRSFE